MNLSDLANHRQLLPGPAALLGRIRDLIERGRLDVGELRLGEALGWILGLARGRPDASIGEVCCVLEAAARLALLKARRLAGQWEARLGEEISLWLGPPAELPLQRSWLADRIARGPLCFTGPLRTYERQAPSLAPVDPEQLRAAMLATLGRRPRPLVAVTPTVVRVSVESRIGMIMEELAGQGELTLADVAGGSRDTCAATFLAALILARQGRVALVQDEIFGDILVRPAAAELIASA